MVQLLRKGVIKMKKYVKPEARELLLATEDVMTTSITLLEGGVNLDGVETPDGVIEVTF
jgi:hypothetical protein